MSNAQTIQDSLLALFAADGNRKRLVVSGGVGYVVFSHTHQDTLEIQAAGGRQLPKGTQIAPEFYQQLAHWGLRQKKAAANFRATSPIDDPQTSSSLWSKRAETILQVAYTASSITVTSRCETLQDPDNSSLITAMRSLAEKRSWSARTGVYTKLIQAQLILLVKQSTPLNGPLEVSDILSLKELGGRPVATVFTNTTTLDKHDPTLLDVRLVTGAELFPLLSAGKFGSLMINPGNDVRGELYSNEIWTVTEGIRRLGGRH